MIIGRWLEQTRETVQIYNSFSHLLQSQPKKIDFIHTTPENKIDIWNMNTILFKTISTNRM